MVPWYTVAQRPKSSLKSQELACQLFLFVAKYLHEVEMVLIRWLLFVHLINHSLSGCDQLSHRLEACVVQRLLLLEFALCAIEVQLCHGQLATDARPFISRKHLLGRRLERFLQRCQQAAPAA